MFYIKFVEQRTHFGNRHRPPTLMNTLEIDSATEPQHSQKQRWLYALTTLGVRLPGQVVTIALLYFYTDVRLLPPLWASGALALYAIYNALNNPIIGYLQDRFSFGGQRRLPWIRFGALPFLACFVLLWTPPFDGATQPLPLLIYMFVVLVLYDASHTAVSNAYYSLLPEIFREYRTRTDVAARMNIVLTIAQMLGIALPLTIAAALGWPMMGALFAAVSMAALVAGLSDMRESRPSASFDMSFTAALRATLFNRSFVCVTLAQMLRFIATQAQATGIIFFVKYSLGRPEHSATTMLATVFVVSALTVYLWRQFIAVRFDARATAMAAYLFAALGASSMWFASSLESAHFTAILIGMGFAGIFLMDNVLLADVVDEDEARTGTRREAMYFGVSSMAGPLALAIVSVVFGAVSSTFGYDPTLDAQPASVALGFRLFITLTPTIRLIAAAIVISFYPLLGERLRRIKQTLLARRTPVRE